MDDITKFKCMIIFYSICIIFDFMIMRPECSEKSEIFIHIILFHYIITTFMLFGWTINNNKSILKVYIVLGLIILLHWINNNWLCIVTEFENLLNLKI